MNIPWWKPTLAGAEENLRTILRAASNEGAPWRRNIDMVDDYPDYAFIVRVGARERHVLMPGCSLDVLMGKHDHLFTPRIYIDGSSCLFEYAHSYFKSDDTDEIVDRLRASRNFRSRLGDYDFHRLLPRTEESK